MLQLSRTRRPLKPSVIHFLPSCHQTSPYFGSDTRRDLRGAVERQVKNKTFRFEEAWLNHEGFISKLPGCWREGSQGTQDKSVILTFTAKLRHCRIRIKEWCANEFYSIRGAKNHLMEEIQRIDKAEE
uniref:Uncharacterized protein n=1 Tax=Ananas comosus var. bracteatus TaxID=296719 RepID=A0A6V7QCH8_ANACO|nr:unnamed protein product [Ananas comosus var. bracteatus]